MRLKERIKLDTQEAMKARNQQVVNVLRMVSAKILEKEVELRRSKGRDYELNDDETIAVLNAYAKQRRQSIDSYRDGGREDLAKQEERELEIVQDYLPQQLSEDEIRAIVAETIQEIEASGPQAIGLVMRAVMPKMKGAADGRVVNAVVKELLSA